MLYGVSETVEFMAIDTANNGVGKISDGGNFTLRWVKDGTSGALSGGPSITEVDSTNEPGLYKVTVAAADTQCLSGTLHGKSSTANIQIIPRFFEVMPAAGSANGVLANVPDVFKKNTARANFAIVMTDSTVAGHPPKPGLNTSLTCQRNIDNGGWNSMTTPNPRETSNGWYVIDFLAGDLNGDAIAIRISATGADDLDFTIATQS